MQTYTSTQASNCRRLQPSLVFQLQLEGSSNPLISFTSLSWNEASTPWFQHQLLLAESFYCHTECFNLQTHCRPRFINFHTGSNSFNTTLYITSTNILCPILQIEQWDHSNQNIRNNPDFRIDMQIQTQPWSFINSNSIRYFYLLKPRTYALSCTQTRIYLYVFYSSENPIRTFH